MKHGRRITIKPFLKSSTAKLCSAATPFMLENFWVGVDYLLFVSPFSRLVLFVVAAAMRSAVSSGAPRLSSDSLICSYWRFLFSLFTPLGGNLSPPV